MDKYEPKIREIICAARGCENVIAQVFDEQYVQSGNLTIYQSFRPICICGKPSAHWNPSEIEEETQSRLEFRREILRSLSANEKFKTQKQKK
jgi:hypothetical protein